MTQERRTVIRATSGTVTVVTTLYGEVDEAKLDKERASLAHRVHQLDYIRPAPREPRYVPVDQETENRGDETW